MNRLFVRSILAALCTGFLFVGNSSVSADEVIPFPDVVHVEQPESPVEATDENLAENLFLEQIGYDPDDAYLYRIHNTAYYHLFATSDNGDVLQLDDASKWSVHPSQRQTVLYWVKSDNIFIKPRSSCFSSYRFVLQNYSTKQAVEVNLINPPLPMGINTFRIINIEYNQRLVLLSNNTVWQIDFNDQNFQYWLIGQRVLVGLNNNWRTATCPNILINADMYNDPYSHANFYGYPAGQ